MSAGNYGDLPLDILQNHKKLESATGPPWEPQMSHDINKCNKAQCYPNSSESHSVLCISTCIVFCSGLAWLTAVNYILLFYFPSLHSDYFIVFCFIYFDCVMLRVL